jgi:hypothetical protein
MDLAAQAALGWALLAILRAAALPLAMDLTCLQGQQVPDPRIPGSSTKPCPQAAQLSWDRPGGDRPSLESGGLLTGGA